MKTNEKGDIVILVKVNKADKKPVKRLPYSTGLEQDGMPIDRSISYRALYPLKGKNRGDQK